LPLLLLGQEKDYQVLDKIIAVIGDEIVMHSDYVSQKAQALSSGYADSPELGCSIFENLLFENLLLHQAKLDSVVVSEAQIQSELDRRIQVFSERMQGVDNLEAFYGKSIAEIKAEFYSVIKDQMTIQTAQGSITQDFSLTPADVTDYFNGLDQDSLPYINSEVEISQILIKPIPSEEEIQRVKDQLNKIRENVLKGDKSFTTAAIVNSEDPGSASKGGDLGMAGKGRMVPEFEAIAYNLGEGEISQVFETEYGYHIMQMIERNGDLYNARHILIIPKIYAADLEKSKVRLNEIQEILEMDSLTFEEAALEYSEDEGTKHNNGTMINPSTGSVRFEMSEIDPSMFFIIDKLKVNETSEPVLIKSQNGKEAYRIVKLRYRSEPHKANLKDDYQLIQNMAEAEGSAQVVDEWIKDKIGNTYIKIGDDFKDCDFQNQWIKNP